MKKCEGMNPLEILLLGIHERKVDFQDEELKQIFFERAVQDLEYSGLPQNRENINQRMCRYATDVLLIADDIYRKYDKSLIMMYDADKNYWITEN